MVTSLSHPPTYKTYAVLKVKNYYILVQLCIRYWPEITFDSIIQTIYAFSISMQIMHINMYIVFGTIVRE